MAKFSISLVMPIWGHSGPKFWIIFVFFYPSSLKFEPSKQSTIETGYMNFITKRAVYSHVYEKEMSQIHKCEMESLIKQKYL